LNDSGWCTQGLHHFLPAYL